MGHLWLLDPYSFSDFCFVPLKFEPSAFPLKSVLLVNFMIFNLCGVCVHMCVGVHGGQKRMLEP